ncbi:MAG TPA: hypothetical protein VFS39_03275, partial [Nitrospira sp.]|nr:hypothetical protein [Nitrospira sp.]
LDGRPETYEDNAMHFKYGSIGADSLRRGIPYRIWQVLPEMSETYLPAGKPATYEAFGLIVDPKDSVDRPIGFSKRWHLGMGNMIGLNCAFCHASTIRSSIEAPRRVILGMPANTVDPEAFFRFLFAVADDESFTDAVLERINAKEPLGYWETFIHRYVLIPTFREGIKKMKHQFGFFDRSPTRFGPGRVDTWAYYKVAKLQDRFWLLEKLPDFGPPYIYMDAGSLTGIADFPALWREKAEGGALHWDGNNTNPLERNITAAMGAGVTPATLDLEAVKRIADWFGSTTYSPESYHEVKGAAQPGPPARDDRGLVLFVKHCGQCHGDNGSRVTEIVDISEIQTDRGRLDAFTEPLSRKLNEVRHLAVWKLDHYRKTSGYANLLLTGIWLRAPYLHNGSVPTLWHLLQDPGKRPETFCRGNDLYDWTNVGFEWDSGKDDCRGSFKYDTRLPGNSNAGHTFGTELSPEDKRHLLEYLKTL